MDAVQRTQPGPPIKGRLCYIMLHVLTTTTSTWRKQQALFLFNDPDISHVTLDTRLLCCEYDEIFDY